LYQQGARKHSSAFRGNERPLNTIQKISELVQDFRVRVDLRSSSIPIALVK
jgi:hypothetical protein